MTKILVVGAYIMFRATTVTKHLPYRSFLNWCPGVVKFPTLRICHSICLISWMWNSIKRGKGQYWSRAPEVYVPHGTQTQNAVTETVIRFTTSTTAPTHVHINTRTHLFFIACGWATVRHEARDFEEYKWSLARPTSTHFDTYTRAHPTPSQYVTRILK
jgi:hypothetical protein